MVKHARLLGQHSDSGVRADMGKFRERFNGGRDDRTMAV